MPGPNNKHVTYDTRNTTPMNRTSHARFIIPSFSNKCECCLLEWEPFVSKSAGRSSVGTLRTLTLPIAHSSWTLWYFKFRCLAFFCPIPCMVSRLAPLLSSNNLHCFSIFIPTSLTRLWKPTEAAVLSRGVRYTQLRLENPPQFSVAGSSK